MHLATPDNLAILAAAHLAAGDLAHALAYATQTQAILEGCGGEGPEFPQQDYFIVYQVLTAAGQSQYALVALQAAYDLVMARADKIIDATLRQSYLEQVAINRTIVMRYKELKLK
jgi:hypothetical protein